MATIGQALISPEAGWRRYDNDAVGIIFTGTWLVNTLSTSYYTNGTSRYTRTVGDTVRFKFKGTKLRIISYSHSLYSDNVKISIDGLVESYSNRGTSNVGYALLYEKLGLDDKVHEVVITMQDTTYLDFDCIDIDDTGMLISPMLISSVLSYLTEKTDINELQIGDVISCDYVASSGVVGTFSNLGNAQLSPLPKIPTAASSGSFYFIMVGYDTLGRKKLVADRDIQYISWNALNNSGLVYGREVQLVDSVKTSLRLLTGGIATGGIANEWDSIIRGSTLGGKVTADSDVIWNHITGDTNYASYVSTADTGGSHRRTLRGSSSTYRGIIAASVSRGYRPVLIVGITNTSPKIEVVQNSYYTFDSDIRLTGSISDRDATDLISYKVVVNGVTLSDWSANSPSPITVDVTVPVSMLTLSTNTVAINVTDGKDTVTKSYTIYKKSIDSTYLLGNTNYNGEATIKVAVSGIAFIKIPDVIRTRGYIRTASLMVDMISGGGSGGSIKVAPIRSDWSGSTVSTLNQPSVDTANAVDVSIPLNNGQVSMDITQVIKRVWNQPSGYGIAIYTTEYPIEFSVLGINVDYQYQATELDQPYVVYGNRVTLNWKPLILERDDAFKKIILLRSTSSDFSSATQVFETPDKSILTFTDTTITKGKAFYSIKVEQLDFPFTGSKIDFDLADEPSFIQQDSVNGTDFEGGLVMMKHSPTTVVSNPMSESTGITFDSTKVEVTGGLVKLKQIT